MNKKDNLKNETANGTKPVLSAVLSDAEYIKELEGLVFVLHFETECFTLTTNFDMETKLENTTESQHDAKLLVMPRLFAITTQDGWNEMFWDKDKAQHKIDTEYKKDFPNEEFWIEEVHVS